MQSGIDMIDVPSRCQFLVANPQCGLQCPVAFIHGGTVLLSRFGTTSAQLWTMNGEKLQAVKHSRES
jgi:hypothetical protein